MKKKNYWVLKIHFYTWRYRASVPATVIKIENENKKHRGLALYLTRWKTMTT